MISHGGLTVVRAVYSQSEHDKLEQVSELVKELFPDTAFVLTVIEVDDKVFGNRVWTVSNMENEGVEAAAKMVLQKLDEDGFSDAI